MKKVFSLIVLVLIFTSSCKKEESKPDNPNVNHNELNVEMKLGSNYGFTEIDVDVNGDGMRDFEFSIYLSPTGNYKERSLYIYGIEADNAIVSDSFLISGYSENVATEQTEGNVVRSTSGFFTDGTYYALEDQSPGYPLTTHGYAGKGDKLLAFKFLIGGNTHYGWMKINLSGSYQHFILKEVAYEVRPDTEIKVGDI